MRRSLLWALALSASLSLAALWPRQTPQVIAAMEPRLREHAAALDAASPAAAAPAAARPSVTLPAELPLLALEPAVRDLFAPEAPPAPKVKAVVAAPMRAAPPEPPRPPALNLRYLGRLRNPQGQQVVFLARGEQEFAVAVGDKLDEGYTVEAIDADAVSLLYAPLDHRVKLAIPRAPVP